MPGPSETLPVLEQPHAERQAKWGIGLGCAGYLVIVALLIVGVVFFGVVIIELLAKFIGEWIPALVN